MEIEILGSNKSINKNRIIKTNIGYFCKESENLITDDITRSTLLGAVEAASYVYAISNDISTRNHCKVEAEVVIYNGFRFEIGKYYINTNGLKVHVLCSAKTTSYGKCFIAESNIDDMLLPLRMTEEGTIGFREITKEDWLVDFAIPSAAPIITKGEGDA
ncbi:MAG: hypothetical protein K0Q47_114 [Sedimentibacter sp.]|nr:hypothetical protein [Sedimentibacter sp.]